MNTPRLAVFAVTLLCLSTALSARAADGTTHIDQSGFHATRDITVSPAGGFPIVLNNRGRYVLTSNIVVPAGVRCGIQIDYVDITLDFNGFALIGQNGQGQVGICVNQDSFTVTGGTIAGFSVGAIGGQVTVIAYEPAEIPAYMRVENMRIVRNNYDTLCDLNCSWTVVVGRSSIVRNNVISDNKRGLFCAGPCVVDHNVFENGERGLFMLGSAAVTNNTISRFRTGMFCVSWNGTCAYSQNNFGDNGLDVAFLEAQTPHEMDPNAY